MPGPARLRPIVARQSCGPARPSSGLTAAIGLVLLVLVMFTGRPVRAADINNGQRLFALHCKLCHGDRGAPVMPQAPAFNRGEGLMQSDLALLASIRAGRNAMPGYLGLLSDREILDVIAFLRMLP